jgi:hypothetical protein
MTTTLDRFEAKYAVDPITGCWMWTASLQSRGYSAFGRSTGHKWSYTHFVGPVPDGYQVNHKCHDWCVPKCDLGNKCPHRRCVNPEHLAAVPPIDNVMSPGSMSLAKLNSEKTHCQHGHELSGYNLMLKNGKRQCRECQRAAQRRWSARQREKGSEDPEVPQ